MEREGYPAGKDGTIALILSAYLGDSLFLMTIANNLRRAGRRVVVFGTYAQALADWYPGFDIRPLPRENEIAALEDFGVIVQMSANGPLAGLDERFAHFVAIKSWQRGDAQALADAKHARLGDNPRDGAPSNGVMASFRVFARTRFGLDDWVADSGLRAPDALRARFHARRVIIHPTSTEPTRCWKPTQYAALASMLRERGFEPMFVLAPAERAAWRDLLARHGLPILDAPDLAHTAAAIYESGWFIGTDSGIGHLASACGVPTVTIVDRVRNMNRWRPIWAPGTVVRPWWLPMHWMRRRYWREATTVGKVLRAFDKLRKCAEATGPMGAGSSRDAGHALNEPAARPGP